MFAAPRMPKRISWLASTLGGSGPPVAISRKRLRVEMSDDMVR